MKQKKKKTTPALTALYNSVVTPVNNTTIYSPLDSVLTNVLASLHHKGVEAYKLSPTELK